MFQIILHTWFVKLSTNQTLRIKHRIRWVHCCLCLRCVPDQSLRFCESHERRCRSVPLVICNDLYLIILPDTNTTVGCSQINSNPNILRHGIQQCFVCTSSFPP
mmetsp:Transcript_5210/g.9165  ORF Transcript_5210/g.9165 Transcript_5210/m.9165 type:complete len:104 (+) Transcript_5210:1701-2012(+)